MAPTTPAHAAQFGENGAEDLAYDPEHCGRVVCARDVIRAIPTVVFEFLADPALQVEFDGNDNLSAAEHGQRVHGVGDIFTMALTNGKVRENHVVEFLEGELIAWKPSTMGEPPAGHLWRWALAATEDGATEVTHTYDWSQLHDQERMARAKSTTSAMLARSVARLKAVVEASA
ncbi:polyketide cyclase [Nesterenkonia sp. Act20]|uniref:polyketide cyclase n=1 Tax=Nesterenkonia sp. Act20 TaxID=1483432 RepID=UPI0021001CF3|nr:polyketide cyclase [Nesterenkonia sp. Act20]